MYRKLPNCLTRPTRVRSYIVLVYHLLLETQQITFALCIFLGTRKKPCMYINVGNVTKGTGGAPRKHKKKEKWCLVHIRINLKRTHTQQTCTNSYIKMHT
jgi:hypothetical protein